MKKPIDYIPQYSLSLTYLRMIMSKRELDRLVKKYVQAKIVAWKKDIRKK